MGGYFSTNENENTTLLGNDPEVSQEGVDVLEKEKQKCAQDIDNLHSEADLLIEECRQLGKQIDYRNAKIHKLGIQIDSQNEKIDELGIQIDSQNAKIEELTTKLSKEMSTKIASDESSVENVNIKNRSMNIAEEYSHLCSTAWLECKVAMNEYKSDTDIRVKLHKLTLLCDIFKVAETVCASELQNFWNRFNQSLIQPFSHNLEEAQEQVIESMKEMKNLIGDQLQKHADATDVTKVAKRVFEAMNKFNTVYPNQDPMNGLNIVYPRDLHTMWHQVKDTQAMTEYIIQAVRLAWKMTLQRPPMRFDFTSKWQGDKMQEMYWDSAGNENTLVYTVYPLLFHKDVLMAKGKVIFVSEEQAKTLSIEVDEDENTSL